MASRGTFFGCLENGETGDVMCFLGAVPVFVALHGAASIFNLDRNQEALSPAMRHLPALPTMTGRVTKMPGGRLKISESISTDGCPWGCGQPLASCRLQDTVEGSPLLGNALDRSDHNHILRVCN